MCGIVGCRLNRPLTPDDLVQLKTMRDALTHRGPDDAGEYSDADKGLYLGHRRLSILDLDPRAAQPMQREMHILCYNGEIYNYRELRQELELDFTFTTDSDTEVLLYAWQKWGAACLDKLDGMFAFALHDGELLHLVTDPFGEKPLYLYNAKDGFYFASEAQVLIKQFDLSFDDSAATQAEFINLGFLQAPNTGYTDLLYLPPAAHYTIAPDGDITHERYWHMPEPHIGSGTPRPCDDNVIDDIRDFLCTTLERRLRSDVPLGLFLSSGVDSALIAALAKRELGVNLKSYTVAFSDGADESQNAAHIAKALEIDHTIINSDEDTLWQNAPKNILDLYSTPVDNTTVFAIYQMCQAAKKHLTVALSGLGGDELFYGYNKYQMFYQNRFIYEHAALFKQLFTALSTLPVQKFKTAHDVLKGSRRAQFLRIKNGMHHDSSDFNLHLDESLPLTHAARLFDLQNTMPMNLIPSVDRGSMRASVEVRTPYLNRDLTHYVMQLDQRSLIHFGKKSVLKRLLARYLDLDLLSQTKQGFVFPLARYFDQTPPAPNPQEQMSVFRQQILSALPANLKEAA